jgi:hypothetical protein
VGLISGKKKDAAKLLLAEIKTPIYRRVRKVLKGLTYIYLV